jgi:hypothetical protein
MAIWLPTIICTMTMARYRAKLPGHDGCKAAKSWNDVIHQHRTIRYLKARKSRLAPW